MKRKFILMLSVLLVLTSCSLTRESEEPEEIQDEKEEDVSIIPSFKESKDQYRIMLPYKPSEARDVITRQISNRFDIDEMEEGLRRHSVDTFDPEKYFLEEGQFLTSDFVFKMIDSNNPKPDDLKSKKDHEENPRIFSHILEQNFLQKTENDNVKLGGVSFGIAVKSVYRFQLETGGPYYEHKISKAEAVKEGEKIAKDLVKELRDEEGDLKGLENVPIKIALYQEQSISSQVPGNYIKQTLVKEGSNEIGKWEGINEKYILFPSNEGKEKHIDDYEKVNNFGNSVAEYFPNYVGVIGQGLYIDDNLINLNINIPLEFYGKNEIIGFTQYIYGLADQTFSKNHDLEIKVTSVDQVESLLYRKAGEDELNVHVFN